MLTTITFSLLKQNSYHLEHMFSLTNIRSLLFQKSPSHCSLPPWGLSDHLSSDWTFKEALDRLESSRRFHDQIRTSIACIWQCAGDHLLYLPPPLTDHQIRTYSPMNISLWSSVRILLIRAFKKTLIVVTTNIVHLFVLPLFIYSEVVADSR